MVIRTRSEGGVTNARRRRFLLQAGAFCGAVAAFGSRPVCASVPAGPRRLRFVHTHTGETLSTQYFDGANYASDALNDVNHLLRDFRTGDEHVIDPALLDLLYDLQLRVDHDAPYEIISLGSDGQEGGSGTAADIISGTNDVASGTR